MGADRIDHGLLLPDQEMACAMQHQAALLLGGLGLNEPHVGPGDRLADRLGVSGIVLLSLDVGFDIGRRHETYCVPERLEFARPVMRRCAGLNADEAWRQLLEECQDIPSLQLAADHHLAYRIDAVDLKNRLRDVETDRRDAVHAALLRIVVTPAATTSMALTCRWRSRPQHQKLTSVPD